MHQTLTCRACLQQHSTSRRPSQASTTVTSGGRAASSPGFFEGIIPVPGNRSNGSLPDSPPHTMGHFARASPQRNSGRGFAVMEELDKALLGLHEPVASAVNDDSSPSGGVASPVTSRWREGVGRGCKVVRSTCHAFAEGCCRRYTVIERARYRVLQLARRLAWRGLAAGSHSPEHARTQTQRTHARARTHTHRSRRWGSDLRCARSTRRRRP